MARTPVPENTSAGPSSSNKPFPQRFTVVEHLPSGSHTVSQSASAAGISGNGHGAGSTQDSSHGEADRFAKNSKGMEERAKNELRDTLRWVARMSNGPVDRRILREAVRLC